jgi:predicted dehydrogenase
MKSIAICGVGNIGRVHARNLLWLRGSRIAGVFDSSPQTLQQVSSQFSVRPYASWQDLLEDPGLDAVVIATPAASHRELCCSALAAGKHVFLEKPMANTLEDSIAIVEAEAKAQAQVVQIGFCERFNVAYLEAKRVVEQGKLGTVRVIQTSRVAPYQYSDPTWELGVYDTAAHNLDLILWMKGSLPRSVLARGTRVYDDRDMRHFCTTVLTFEDGSLAVDTIAWLRKQRHPLSECAESQMLIQGSQGSFHVDQSSRPAWFMDDQHFKASDTVILGGPEYYGCLKLQLDHFLGAIAGEVQPTATAREAFAAEKVVLAAVQSLKSGCEVALCS